MHLPQLTLSQLQLPQTRLVSRGLQPPPRPASRLHLPHLMLMSASPSLSCRLPCQLTACQAAHRQQQLPQQMAQSRSQAHCLLNQ